MPVGVLTSGHTGEKNRHFHGRQGKPLTLSAVLGLTAGETAKEPHS